MTTIKMPVVAGKFYPEDPRLLQNMLTDMLQKAKLIDIKPRALIVPHAGYQYSGEIAASGYKQLEPIKDSINRVVLLGPSHRVAFTGCAISHADFFRTPLGDIPIDREAIKALNNLPQIQQLENAYAEEHSLEVHLPFLQTVLDYFTLVPVVVGNAEAKNVMEVLEYFWHDIATLFVISSDLSHFHNYQTAQKMDEKTSQEIVHLHPENINGKDACGKNPVNGLLELAKKYQMQGKILDVRNSGDTAGDKNQVVGYGAYGFF